MSEFFKWDPNTLSVKVTAMDDEHKVLIGLMNKLYDRHEAKATKDELGKILKELVNYTVKHFKDEEQYMDSIKFPEANTHKTIHKNLLSRLEGYGKEFEKSGTLSKEFFNFLKVWLSAHIQSIDIRYSNHASGLKAAG